QDDIAKLASFVPNVKKQDGYTEFKMGQIHLWRLSEMAGNPGSVTGLMRKIQIVNGKTAHQKLRCTESKKKVFDIDIIYDGQDEFKTKCSCGDMSTILCNHVYAAFVMLESNFGNNYFRRFKDYSQEKGKILHKYGLSPDDDEAKNFEWSIDYWGN